MKKTFLILIFTSILLLNACNKEPGISPVTNTSEITTTIEQTTTTEEQHPIGYIEEFASGFVGALGIAIDNFGNMYVSNRNNSTISKVTPEGEVSHFVSISCRELLLLTTDEEGNIYAAGGNKVFKITPDKTIIELATGFTNANDLRIDNENNLYITDAAENIVYKINPDGVKTIYINNTYDGGLHTWFLTGISFSPNYDYLYTVRMQKGQVLRYPILNDGSAGVEEILIEGVFKADHMEVDKNGNLYVTTFMNGKIIQFDSEGNQKLIIDDILMYPAGIVLGKGPFGSNYMYIADHRSSKVYRIYIG